VVKCPKWRRIFESNIVKQETSYNWKFNMEAVYNSMKFNYPNNLLGWPKTTGLFTGRVLFAFPDNSRYVYLNTNTLPMMTVCPQCKGYNQDIFSIGGDEGVQNHWVYEREDEVSPYAWRVANFLRHYDGVHVLLNNRDEVGKTFIPDLHLNRNPRDQIPDDRTPAHYYHNWRFKNVYGEQKQEERK
jgi:hypothetical protein